MTQSPPRASRAQGKFLVSRIRVSPGRKGDPVSAQGEPGPRKCLVSWIRVSPGKKGDPVSAQGEPGPGKIFSCPESGFLSGETVTRSLPGASCGVLMVSTDVKSVPYTSMTRYKYFICFVDHYSRLGFCYSMRHKNESAKIIKDFLREMQCLGLRVRTI